MKQRFFEKLTYHSKSAIRNAFHIAKKSNVMMIEPKHILYGILEQKGSLGYEILKQVKINIEDILTLLKQNENQPSNFSEKSPYLSLESEKIVQKAVSTASLHNHIYIGTEHLLSGLLECRSKTLDDFFKTKNINIPHIKDKLHIVLKSTSKFPDLTDAIESPKGKDEDWLGHENKQTKTKGSFLEYYGSNLTDETVQSRIDPVIGRQKEIERLIQILCRRTKNNPLLLGDPGVGKTAIVEGLAKKILQGDVPEVLLDKKIYTLDLALIIAGSSFRGEFENRLKNIISELKSNPNIILFIDEIHNLIGAGSATGSMDAANILKPSLARGEIRCIGATTMEEYKKYIENDMALERRFQPILVDQPSVQKAIEILKGIKGNYETYHRVVITDEAIEAACKLSERYIQDKFLPDKAIDLIDEAAAAYRIQNYTTDKSRKIKNIENEIKALQILKQKAVFSENFDLALDFRQKEETLNKKKIMLKKKYRKENTIFLGEITENDILKVISKVTHVPLEQLMAKEKNTLLQLEKLLSKKIIGQDHALSAVAECIRRSKAGISHARRPLGSMIFLGPSGVGKTELAKTLAEQIFGGPENLIRIDMSEFSESFNISKLIGSPAGYVGYKDSTRLTDAVRKRPYSVVLFDEVEKAHSQILNLLLQILEDGHLTDASGKLINFKNTIIIMTSNIGSDEFNKLNKMGFRADTHPQHTEQWNDARQSVMKKLGDFFRNEFINRIDKIVIFNALAEDSLRKIAKLQMDELRKRLLEANIEIGYNINVLDHLTKLSVSRDQGARLIRKNIQEHVENKLVPFLIQKKLNKSLALHLGMDGTQIKAKIKK